MKKLISMLLTIVMVFSFMTVSFANDDVPSDLPPGTIKIADGIYEYTPPFGTYNIIDDQLVGTVPGVPQTVTPSAFNNVILDANHKYLRVTSTKPMRVNFGRGQHSLFDISAPGTWPTVGSSYLYIDALAFGIASGVPYQMIVTGVSDIVQTNVRASVRSTINR